MSETPGRPANDDGWTTVPQRKRRRAKAYNTPDAPDKDLTLEMLMVNYEKRMRTWQASACRKEVRQILDRKQPDDGWQIKAAICVASGSFSRDNVENRKRSLYQFAAFMDIVQHLQTTSSENIDIVSQECIYTDVDVEFLSKLGIIVYNVDKSEVNESNLKSGVPSIKDHLGSGSFVFEAFIQWDSPTARQLFTAQVRLIIGSALPAILAHYPKSEAKIVDFLHGGTTSPNGSVNWKLVEDTRKILEQYKPLDVPYSTYYFPHFEEDWNVFGGLQIAWKEWQDDEPNNS